CPLMDIWLLRHGRAADKGRYSHDADRPLTQEGRKELRRVAKGMRHLGVEPDVILSSPTLRARQTAELVCERLEWEKRLKYSPLLAAGEDPAVFLKEIPSFIKKIKTMMLVGHEPF